MTTLEIIGNYTLLILKMNKSLPCILHQKNEYELHTQIRITFPRRKLSVTSRGTVFFKLMNSFDMTGSGELLNHTELNYLSSLGNSISIMNLSFSGDRDSISFFFIFLSSSMHNSHRCSRIQHLHKPSQEKKLLLLYSNVS